MSLLFNTSSRFVLMLGLVALCFQNAFAHTYLSSVFLNNQLLPEGDCVRPHPRTEWDFPIPLVTSPEMKCGWYPANSPANRKCPIAAGSSIGIQWHHNSNSPSDDIIDPSHVGPIMFYLAKSDSGDGDVWFKIYEDGFANGKWAVDRLIANRGRIDITIPSDIAPGNYLLRGELIALHGAYALNGVQPYVGCVELTISGSGNASPRGVSFPGYYKNTDPGMLMSVYQPFSKYIIPGPAVYVPSSSSTSSPTSTPSTPAPTTRPTPVPPTTAPTTRPDANNIQVGLNGGSNEWWVGVIVAGGSETTVKVELKDSASINTWTALVDKSYYYELERFIVAPLSLRLTSSTGKQVVLENVFYSLSTGGKTIDTGKTYTSNPSTPAPTTPPTYTPTTPPTSKPTYPPTNPPTTKPTNPPTNPPTEKPTNPPTNPPTVKPTNPPSNGNAKVTVYPSAGEWWFALTVSGVDAAKVEIKDSGDVKSYASMTKNVWGPQEVYTYSTTGSALKTPLSIRVTSKSGAVETVTVSRISPNAVFEASA